MKPRVNRAWEVVPLGTLADFRNGVNYTKNSFGRGIKIINVKNFRDYSIASYDDLDEIDPGGVVRDDDVLRDNDIIFVRSNGNRELIGRSMFISVPRERVTHSAFTIRARFTSDRALPRFYAYLFRSPLIRHTLSAQGGGTNISNLNQGILSSLEVPLPPFSVQESIVEILSAYDDLIRNNTRRIEILDASAKAIYREWFVRFRFPGHEKAKMFTSELGTLPQTWGVQRVRELVKRLKAGRVYTDADVVDEGNVPVIDQSRTNLLGYHDNEPDLWAKPINPIVVFGDHTCTMRLMVEPFSVGPNVVPFISNTELPILYLYFVIRNLVETREYKRHWTELANKTVTVAARDVAEEFARFTTTILEEINLLMHKSENLRRSRDLLLPKLMSGGFEPRPNS